MTADVRWFRGPAGAVFTMAPSVAFPARFIDSLVESGEWTPIEDPTATPAEEPPTPAPEPAPAPVKRGPGRPRKNP